MINDRASIRLSLIEEGFKNSVSTKVWERLEFYRAQCKLRHAAPQQHAAEKIFFLFFSSRISLGLPHLAEDGGCRRGRGVLSHAR